MFTLNDKVLVSIFGFWTFSSCVIQISAETPQWVKLLVPSTELGAVVLVKASAKNKSTKLFRERVKALEEEEQAKKEWEANLQQKELEIVEEKHRLNNWVAARQQEFDEERSQIDQTYAGLQELTTSIQKQALATVTANKAECDMKIDELTSRHNTNVATYQGIIESLQERIKRLNVPDYIPNPVRAYEYQVNQILKQLHDWGILAREVVCYPTGSGFDLSFQAIQFLEDRCTATIPQVIGFLKTATRLDELRMFASSTKPVKIEAASLERLKLSFDTESVKADDTSKFEQRKLRIPQGQSKEKFREYLFKFNHLAVAGLSGLGKTTLLGEIIRAFNEDLGGNAQLVVTTAKPDSQNDSLIKAFGKPKYRLPSESIYGLLECAAELAYRLWLNVKAEDNNQPYPNHQPIIFFFDEATSIFQAWGKVEKPLFETVLAEFESRLVKDRLDAFQEVRRLISHNNLASGIINWVWNTGRSERVKTLISGQKLRPANMGVNLSDLGSAGYICLGDNLIDWALKSYITSDKERSHLAVESEIWREYHLINKDKRYALFCTPNDESYFDYLPTNDSNDVTTAVENKNHTNELTNPQATEKQQEGNPGATQEQQQLGEQLVERIHNRSSSCPLPVGSVQRLVAKHGVTHPSELWQQASKLLETQTESEVVKKFLGGNGRHYQSRKDFLDWMRTEFGNHPQ